MVTISKIASAQDSESYEAGQERGSWRTLDYLLNWLNTLDTAQIDKSWLYQQIMDLRPVKVLGKATR